MKNLNKNLLWTICLIVMMGLLLGYNDGRSDKTKDDTTAVEL